MRTALFLLCALILPLSGVAIADDDVSDGTVLQGTLSADISTASAHVGDRVVIESARDASGNISGTLMGHVTQVQQGGQGRHPQLAFVIDSLSTDGSSYSVQAVSQGIRAPGASSGRETTAALTGALAGAVLGKILGHSNGAMLAGAVVGAGAAFAVTSNNYQNIVLQQGSTVRVLLKSVTRMQARDPQ